MLIFKSFSSGISGKSGKYIMLFSALVLAVFLLPAARSFSQTGFRSVSIGLATTQLLGDDPGARPMLEFDSTKVPFFGGSFDGNQPGISLRFNFIAGDSDFVIPVGGDFTFFHSAERVPLSKFETGYLKHWVYAPSGVIGFNYFFMKFPIANVRAFGGVEARATYLFGATLYRNIVGGLYDTLRETRTKPDAFRFGGAARIGVEGEILYPWYIHASCAWGVMNLLGKDNERRELLTPTKFYETRESTVVNFLFSLMIQYKF